MKLIREVSLKKKRALISTVGILLLQRLNLVNKRWRRLIFVSGLMSCFWRLPVFDSKWERDPHLNLWGKIYCQIQWKYLFSVQRYYKNASLGKPSDCLISQYSWFKLYMKKFSTKTKNCQTEPLMHIERKWWDDLLRRL